MSASNRYETEVELQTADGQHVTYSGDGVGPEGMSGDQLLDSAEAAALAAEPGATVVSSRARTA
ncbi:hypothetical protein ABT390_34245 [Streptomyces aurantiacus]|uniref:Uncharacterized protein n=1 Tax=Streptomyces aurantiacus JA 4570 TaxID=1286094 RepID=S3ZST8_9ACTN|nr:hypothetical protein [Streptomyces aurantiacus]EPH41470.1 hypothetical protein STRAU_5474 [Streptomyces aurantiacus JA 4570]